MKKFFASLLNFNNPGTKIKFFAYVAYLIEIILTDITLIILFVIDAIYFDPLLLLVLPIIAFVGFILSALIYWIPSIVLYGFGELIENSKNFGSLTSNSNDACKEQNNCTDSEIINCETKDVQNTNMNEKEYEKSEAAHKEKNTATSHDKHVKPIKNSAKAETRKEIKESPDKSEIKPKEQNITPSENATLEIKLSFALKYSTDASLIDYLKSIADSRVQNILNMSTERIRPEIKKLLDEEYNRSKGWLCSCGAKNKTSAKECAFCYKKREEISFEN